MPALFLEKAHKLQGRTTWKNFDVSIENKPGSVRKGVDPDGSPWRTKMRHAYGYLRKTLGVDGDGLDCYMGPDPKARFVYIITTNNPETGKVDEQKIFLDFSTKKDALKSFNVHFDEPEKFFRSIVAVPVAKFVKKAKSTFDNPRLLRAAVSWALFEDGVRRFREATKKPKIYYARSTGRYATPAEAADLRYLAKRFPDHEIVAPMSKDHASKGMEHFFRQVDEADMVVVRPRAKQNITHGVFSELRHAEHQGIPIFHLRNRRLSRVKASTTKFGTGNHRGNFARVILDRGQ